MIVFKMKIAAGFDNWREMMNFLSENVTYVQP